MIHLFGFCFLLWLRLHFLFQVILCFPTLLFPCCLSQQLLCLLSDHFLLVHRRLLHSSTALLLSSWLPVSFVFFQVLIVVNTFINVFVYKFRVVIHPGSLAGFWYDVVIVDMVSTCILLGCLYHSHNHIHTDWSHLGLQDGRLRCPVRVRQITHVFPTSVSSLLARNVHVGWWSFDLSLVRVSGSRGRYFLLFFTVCLSCTRYVFRTQLRSTPRMRTALRTPYYGRWHSIATSINDLVMYSW